MDMLTERNPPATALSRQKASTVILPAAALPGKAASELRRLWDEWDPGGLAAFGPRPRYDAYARGSLRMLEARASELELAHYVRWVLVERLALDGEATDRLDPFAFARRMQGWYGAR
jgi:hypothetical protein